VDKGAEHEQRVNDNTGEHEKQRNPHCTHKHVCEFDRPTDRPTDPYLVCGVLKVAMREKREERLHVTLQLRRCAHRLGHERALLVLRQFLTDYTRKQKADVWQQAKKDHGRKMKVNRKELEREASRGAGTKSIGRAQIRPMEIWKRLVYRAQRARSAEYP
jgi:hypothetical protein